MIGLVVLAAMVAVALCTVRHLWIACALVIAVLVLVPQVAAPVVGIPVVQNLNLGTVFLVVIATVQLVARARTYLQDVLETLPTALAVLTLVGMVALTSLANGAVHDQQFLVDSVAPSAVGAALVRRAAADAPGAGTRLAQSFVAVVVVECVIALLVWSGVVPQPFEGEYAARYYWFDPTDTTRALGTADSFLELSVVVLIGTALLRCVRRGALVAPCAALFVATLLAAQARAALALAVVALVALLVARRVPFLPAATVALVSASVATTTFLTVPELGSGLTAKLADDNGSAGARTIGLAEGVPELAHHLILGGGSENAVTTATRLGLGTSFENPALMIGLCWGLVASVCYFGILTTALLAGGARPRAVEGGRLAGALALVAVMTYSSVAFVTGLGTLLWMTVALGSSPPTPSLPAAPPIRRHPAADHPEPPRSAASTLVTGRPRDVRK